jgi:hypothetical protein
MSLLLWITAGLLFAVCVWLASMNAYVFFKGFILRKKAPSWIPLVGGLCGALSVIALPVPGVRYWWWVPLVLDWGSVPGLLTTLFYILSRSRSGNG